MRRHFFPKPYADFVARLRAPGGFLLVAAFLWFSEPTPRSLLWGLPVSVLGLWLRGWAAGHLAKNARLATSGPYAWVRNPLYLGTLLVAAGLTLAAQSPWLAGLFAAVFLLVYLPAIELEEQYLRELFPGVRTICRAGADAVPTPPACRRGRTFSVQPLPPQPRVSGPGRLSRRRRRTGLEGVEMRAGR